MTNPTSLRSTLYRITELDVVYASIECHRRTMRDVQRDRWINLDKLADEERELAAARAAHADATHPTAISFWFARVYELEQFVEGRKATEKHLAEAEVRGVRTAEEMQRRRADLEQRAREAEAAAEQAVRTQPRVRFRLVAVPRIGRQSRGRRVQRNVTKKLAAKAATGDPDPEPPRRSACAPAVEHSQIGGPS